MNKLYILAAAALGLSACNSDEDYLGAFESDPNAVHFSVQIAGENQATLDTKAVGETTAFAEGAKIAVTAGTQDEVNYILKSNNWAPESTDKYLLWEKATGLEFNAYYPVGVNDASLTNFTLPETYNDSADELEAANYMTATTTAKKADGTVALTMEHKMARAIIKVTNINNQYTDKFKVTSIKMHVNYSAYQGGNRVSGAKEVEMLPQDNNKTFYALVVPTDEAAAETFLTITGADNDGQGEPQTLTVKGIPAMAAGSSYTFKLTVGKVEAKVASVTVNPWTDGEVIAKGEEAEEVTLTYPYADAKTHTIFTDAEGQLGNDEATEALINTALGEGDYVKVVGPISNTTASAYAKFGKLVKNLDLSDATITTLPNEAFVPWSSTRSLETITLPATVTKIPDGAFMDNSNLAKITCKGAITEIGNGAFKSLAQNVTLDLTANTDVAGFASSVYDVFSQAFSETGIINNKAVDYHYTVNVQSKDVRDKFLANSVWAYGEKNGFVTIACPAYADASTNTVHTFANGQLTEDLIKEAVGTSVFPKLIINGPINSVDFLTTLGNSKVTFKTLDLSETTMDAECLAHLNFNMDAIQKVETLTLSKSMTTVTNGMNFSSTLKTLTLPSNITTIGENTFNACTNLTTITCKGVLTEIGEKAFNGCSSLTTLDLSAVSYTTAPTIVGNEDQLFYSSSDLVVVYVKDEASENVFKNGNKWSTLKDNYINISINW